MSVSHVEQCANGVIKVILKPTKAFPEGSNFFYTDEQALPVVERYTWCLLKHDKRVYVIANSYREKKYFHREYMFGLLGYCPNYIDHINGIDMDNTAMNLKAVTNQQNILNKPSRGYEIYKRKDSFGFKPVIAFSSQLIRPFSCVDNERDVCILQYRAEHEILRYKLGDDFYQYNFLLDRRNDLDILDAERTGRISQEEAIYRHVLRYADNAWYFYRYNLTDYFSQHNIPVPNYKLNESGRMIHPITGNLLCPYNK